MQEMILCRHWIKTKQRIIQFTLFGVWKFMIDSNNDSLKRVNIDFEPDDKEYIIEKFDLKDKEYERQLTYYYAIYSDVEKDNLVLFQIHYVIQHDRKARVSLYRNIFDLVYEGEVETTDFGDFQDIRKLNGKFIRGFM